MEFENQNLGQPVSQNVGGFSALHLSVDAVEKLAQKAFEDVSHLMRATHLAQLKSILDDPEATQNDKFVALELLKNATVAAEFEFPSCQDTGTAIVLARKGNNVLADGCLRSAIERGIETTWKTRNLRFSQMAPLSLLDEANTGTNLPAQIDIEAVEGERLELLFMAKGGGSANKTFLFQETPRILDETRLLEFFDAKIRTLGTAACPPYHLAIVIGGLSAEQTLKYVKLASAKELDDLPQTGDAKGRPFRDTEFEEKILDITRNLTMGAQFGGKYFCHDVRVIRLPRHGGSMPIGMGVSCSADRQIKGYIDKTGVWLEKLERDPAKYLPTVSQSAAKPISLDLNMGMDRLCDRLNELKVSTPLMLSGSIIVARDLVHKAFSQRLAEGKALPDYFRDFPIYYAGPAKTPQGYASGSFGPTTAARMDPYIPEFQALGFSRIMIAKGNRSKQVIDSCRQYNGFYLGSVGGAAAVLGKDVIKKVEPIDFEDFGMEAVFRIDVENFPAFLVTDNKGNDFFTRPPVF